MKYLEFSRRPANSRAVFGPTFTNDLFGFSGGLGNVERAFGDLLQGFGAAKSAAESPLPFTPRLDVAQTETAVIVKVELAGVEEKDVEITLDEDRLTIKGEKRREEESVKGEHLHLERSYGAFKRELVLQSEIDRDKVTAKYRNGVLEVTLPKTPAAKSETRKIAINA